MADTDNFKMTKNEVFRLLALKGSKLARETNDNSFPNFLEEFCKALFSDLEKAINGVDLNILDVNNKMSNLSRLTSQLGDILYYKNIDNEEANLYKDIIITSHNWIRLYKESIEVDSESNNFVDLKNLEVKLAKINNILDGNLTLRDLVDINRKLIKRAEQVYYNVPSNFKPSESFLSAIKSAVEGDLNTNDR